MTVRARSPLYETDAVTPDPQPRYPERGGARGDDAGRQPRCWPTASASSARSAANAPPAACTLPARIDVDILLYGGEVIDDPPALIVPHPRLHARPFVRIPLSDVAAPGLRHPITGEPLDRAAPDPAVKRA